MAISKVLGRVPSHSWARISMFKLENAMWWWGGSHWQSWNMLNHPKGGCSRTFRVEGIHFHHPDPWENACLHWANRRPNQLCANGLVLCSIVTLVFGQIFDTYRPGIFSAVAVLVAAAIDHNIHRFFGLRMVQNASWFVFYSCLIGSLARWKEHKAQVQLSCFSSVLAAYCAWNSDYPQYPTVKESTVRPPNHIGCSLGTANFAYITFGSTIAVSIGREISRIVGVMASWNLHQQFVLIVGWFSSFFFALLEKGRGIFYRTGIRETTGTIKKNKPWI